MKLSNLSSMKAGTVRRARKALQWSLAGIQILALVALSAVPSQAAQTYTSESEGMSTAYIFASQSVETAKFFQSMGDRSLRLDSNKRPHIAYGGDHLYYASHNGTTWQYEVADASSGVGKYASLSLDKNNKPHIAYYDASRGGLKYARKTGTAWETFLVDAGPFSMLAGESGLPAVEDADIPVRETDGRDWHYSIPGSGNLFNEEVEIPAGEVIQGEPFFEEGQGEVVELEEEYQPAPEDDPELMGEEASGIQSVTDLGRGQYTSIAVNSFGYPQISYYDYANGNLKFASWNGSNWMISTIDSYGDVGSYTSVALDKNEMPHISYYDATLGNLKYTRWTGIAWTMPAVIDNGGDTSTSTKYVGLYSSISIDRNNNPHISYYDKDAGNLKYARASSGAWTSSVVDSAGDIGLHTSIMVDRDLRAHISYYNATSADLKYALCSGVTCTLQTAAAEGFQGRYTSLALDDIYPRISFYDSGTGQLKYAYPSGSSWAVHILDGSADLGLFSSLALDMNGSPRIAYFDDVRDNLKYAYWDQGTWKVATVDQNGEVGLYASLALNKTSGYPTISYYDATNGRLKVATWVGTSWVIETPDSGPDAGTHSALALDANGNPRVVYCKGKGCLSGKTTDPMEVRVAVKANNTWVSRPVESGGVGMYSSIAVDSQGSLHISYYDAAFQRLRYAKGTPDGAAWQVTILGSGQKMGLFTSIAVDSLNRPHISFFNDSLDSLRYVTWNGAWVEEVVDGDYGVGWDTSIALDSSGNPHISYYDINRHRLKYAVRQSGVWRPQVVDGDAYVGMYSSIALKNGTTPVISYYDAINGNLKYAYTINGHTTYLPLVRR
jgi:hypothetical protein